MAKTIDTLISDISNLLDNPNKDIEFDVERLTKLGSRMVGHVVDEIRDPDRTDRDPMEVYVTQITPPCQRRVWYNVFGSHVPSERVAGSNRFKFLYGDLIEEAVLFLAEMAGHSVTHTQHRMSMPLFPTGYKLAGRTDAVIDNVLVDVKSMEQYSFARWQKDGRDADKWGYITQLKSYEAMLEAEGVVVDAKGILCINKTNGKMHLHLEPKEASSSLNLWKNVIAMELSNPRKLYNDPLEDTTTYNGMTVLGAQCSYCPYKFDCYNDKGLEVYAYSEGPKFVVGKPKKEPKVPKITEAWIKDHITKPTKE